MKYFISTGEASGDLHASMLVGAIKEIDHEATFAFLGGDKMVQATGVSPLIGIDEMSVMGFHEVIKKLPVIFRQLSTAKNFIKEWHPDAVILVDYPSFNLKLAKFAHGLGIKVFWYISPKVWVWKEHRVKALKRYVDKMYCILPFEVDYFRNRHGWEVEYVGNPSVEEVRRESRRYGEISAAEYFASKDIPTHGPMLALLPGSRVKEIESNLPVMMEVARRNKEFTPVIARSKNISEDLYDRIAPGVSSVFDDTFRLLYYSQAALVTSGTATLETALLKVPQVMMYRHSGSKWFYKLFRRLLKVRFFSLPNLINDKETIPELVMHFCTPDNVDRHFKRIISGEARELQQREYMEMAERLGDRKPSESVAADIYAILQRNR